MKPWLKWAAAGLIIAALAAGAARTLSARKASQLAFESQQAAQKTQVAIELQASDLIVVKAMDMPISLVISGPVKATQTAMVKARIPGELQGLTVREGDFVRAGQVLARIDPTESEARVRQARQQAQAAKAQVDIAQRAYDNNRALVTQGFISGTALESSQAVLSAAQATYAAAQSGAELTLKALEDTALRAPIAGQIAQRLAQAGERVAVDTRILEIVDNSRLELEAALTAAESLQVKLGQTALLRVEGTSQSVGARVIRINPSATQGSRAVLVYLAIEPGTPLRHGLFAEGRLTTGMLNTLAIPLSSVRTDKPRPYVQMLRDNLVHHQNVEMGARSEVNQQAFVSITGVPEGAVVIAGTVGSVRAGTPTRTVAGATGTL